MYHGSPFLGQRQGAFDRPLLTPPPSLLLGFNFVPIGEMLVDRKLEQLYNALYSGNSTEWHAKEPEFEELDRAGIIISLLAFILALLEVGVLSLVTLWHLFVACRLPGSETRPKWRMIVTWLVVALLNILNVLNWFYLLPGASSFVYNIYAGFSQRIVLALLPWVALCLVWIFWPQYVFSWAQYRRLRKRVQHQRAFGRWSFQQLSYLR
jgi:hypothetical protein